MKIINKIIEDAVHKELTEKEMVLMSKDRLTAAFIASNSIYGDLEKIRLELGSLQDKIKDGEDPNYNISCIEFDIESAVRSIENIQKCIGY